MYKTNLLQIFQDSAYILSFKSLIMGIQALKTWGRILGVVWVLITILLMYLNASCVR